MIRKETFSEMIPRNLQAQFSPKEKNLLRACSLGSALFNNVVYKIYLFCIIALYYSWFWVNHNQTLGMKAWKTLVINENNHLKITYRQSLVRLIVALMGGHILLLFSKKSLQDILSGTKLVKKN